jgi:hypothetical protein
MSQFGEAVARRSDLRGLFYRLSPFLFVKLEDIRLDSAGLHFFKVKKAKNHCLGFNMCLLVKRKRIYCMGAFVLDYLEKGLKWVPGASGFLYCKVDGAGFLSKTTLSYSTFQSSFKDLIRVAGLNPSRFSTHSAKRGSATAAVEAGCSDAEVTSLGRWRSANTGRLYFHDGPKFRKNLSARYSL